MQKKHKWNPYAAAAEALQSRKKDIDAASEEKARKDERLKKAEPDPDRDPAEETELTKTAPRLRDYRIRKNIGGDTPAEVRLYELQEKRLKSYKYGTKKVPKTGPAMLHKGEAVLTVKQAKKYRGRKVKAAASALGAGKKKVPTKTQRLIRSAGHELKTNPPKILRSTQRKKGPKQAEKQRVAIMLSKARSAGADIPEK